jgi:hypothetical protein
MVEQTPTADAGACGRTGGAPQNFFADVIYFELEEYFGALPVASRELSVDCTEAMPRALTTCAPAEGNAMCTSPCRQAGTRENPLDEAVRHFLALSPPLTFEVAGW